MKKVFLFCLLMALLAIPFAGVSAEDEAGKESIMTWAEYQRAHANMLQPEKEIWMNAAQIYNQMDADCRVEELDGREALIWENEKGSITWEFQVEKAGLYALEVEYYALEGTKNAVEIELMLNGRLPFLEAGTMKMTRLFRDSTHEFSTDQMGNDMRPTQVEIPAWQKVTLRETDGYYNGAYLFALEEGNNTLTLQVLKEPVALAAFRFYTPEIAPAYEEYAENAQAGGEYQIILEAEKPASKTSTMLYAISDRSDAATSPSDPIAKKLNAIGGGNWKNGSQSITWDIEVPQDGWYTLAFRFKQDYLRGMNVYRRIEIDGQVPFAEMEAVPFEYSVSWQVKSLAGDDGDYYIYLKAGSHQLTLTPTTGEFAGIITQVNESVVRLNDLYRRIIMITGTNPDIYRDYYLHKELPGLQDELTALAEELLVSKAQIEAITGTSGSDAEILGRTAEQLKSFAKSPNTIPERLTTFSDNLIAVSEWTLNARDQGLLLDKIVVSSAGKTLPDLKSTLGQRLRYRMGAFFGSFVTDYEAVGVAADTDKKIKVWIYAGRDQAEVLKELIDRLFTPEYGIGVELNIVQGGLMQAVMAGQGPDVALMLGHGDPVNYALRGAVLPLNDMEGFEEMGALYMPDALVPYIYDGKCYALPNSQNFYMLFYRTDIFEELELKAPKTWDDLLVVAETLQRNNMNIGLPYVSQDAYASISSGIGTANLFPTLLLQTGEKMYTEEGLTSFSNPGALASFKRWTEYYTQYGFPLYKNDFSRFRTGEMPLVITGYTFYNQLQTAAPELRNNWAMAVIPGTLKEDGTVDHTTVASGTAGVILADTEYPEESWKFLKWWNDTQVQAEYGRNIENTLGAAGRYNPANVDAMRSLDWSGRELDMIMEQWRQVREIEERPGSYYVSRNLDNAFKAVYYDNENYREALNYWNKQINAELKRKQAEYEQIN